MTKRTLSLFLTITMLLMPFSIPIPSEAQSDNQIAGISFAESFLRSDDSYETVVYVMHEGTIYYAVIEHNSGNELPDINYSDINNQISNLPNVIFASQGLNSIYHTPVTTPSAVHINVSNLEPGKSYAIYAVHSTDSSDIITKVIPVFFRTILNASYDNGQLNNLNDDTITIVLDQLYPDESLETFKPIIGIAGTSPFKELRYEDGYTSKMFGDPEKTTIILTLDAAAVTYLKDVSHWSNPTAAASEIFILDNSYFPQDYLFSDFQLTHAMVTMPDSPAPSEGYQLTSLLVDGQSVSGFHGANLQYVHNVPDTTRYNAILSSPEGFITFTSEAGSTPVLEVFSENEGEFLIFVDPDYLYWDIDTEVYTLKIMNVNLENALSGVLINGSPYNQFSTDTNQYNISLGTSTNKPSITPVSAFDLSALPFADASFQTSGSLPGTYIVTMTLSVSGESRHYTFRFTSSSPVSGGGSDDGSGGNAIERPPTPPAPPATPAPTTTTTTIASELLSSLDLGGDSSQLTEALKQLEEVLKTETNPAVLLNVTTALSNTAGALATAPNASPDIQPALAALAKTVGAILEKVPAPEAKLSILSDFTGAVLPFKNASQNTSDIDQLIMAMVRSIEASLSSVQANLQTGADGSPEYTLGWDELLIALKMGEDARRQFKDIVESYFGEYSYLNLNDEVLVDLDNVLYNEGLQFGLDAGSWGVLHEFGVDELNLKMEGYTVTLPSEHLMSENTLSFMLHDPNESTLRDNSSTLSDQDNNQKLLDMKHLDCDLFREGELAEHLGTPIRLSFELDYFDVNVDDDNGYDMAVFRYDEDGKTWEPVGGIYDPITGTISVFRTHLSQYTVMKASTAITSAGDNQINKYVQVLINKGIVTAAGNEKDKLTREEFVSWLARSYGLTTSSVHIPFADVDPQDSTYKYVASTYEQGIVRGRSPKEFNGKDDITYEEVAVMLSNTLTKLGNKKTNPNLTKKWEALGSMATASEWSKDKLALMLELGIMDNKAALNSKSHLTREEAAEIFVKFYR